MKRIFLAFIALALTGSIALAQEKPGAEKSAQPAAVYKNIKPDEFDKLRKAGGANTIVLDVRTKEENRAGRIPGSVQLDIMSDDFEKELAKLDKKKTYLVHCAVGGRSARACKKMGQLGFKELYNLEGGMQAWEKAGKPVEK
jgi:rhodanese-related sulfurtransferase